MTDTRTLSDKEYYDFEANWPRAHGWAIEQMPYPAYCCTPDGAIVRCNASAERLWGWRPSEQAVGLWHGFDSLQSFDGKPIDKSLDPAALAASGANATEIELLAKCRDGQTRRIVARAKSITGPDGKSVGFLCCLIDITDRWRFEQKAREALESRNDFLTVLAHELRNPLSPIMSAAKILNRASIDPTMSKVVETVERQARTLSRFISDLLDGARIDNLWQLNIEPRSCLLSDVLQRATEVIQQDLRLRKQNFAIDASDLSAPLLCDPKRIAQALGNVLGNASKFTPDDGEVRLSIVVDGEILKIEISDQGPGIEPDELDQLFVPFGRNEPAPSRAPSGAGVGLAIAKSVCEAHHGTISARNSESGKGAIFTLSLPIVSIND